jgi:PAS domain S-box-containing protein
MRNNNKSRHDKEILTSAMVACVVFWLLTVFAEYLLSSKHSIDSFLHIAIIHLVIFIVYLIIFAGIIVLYINKQYKSEELAEKSERIYHDIFENATHIYIEILTDGTIIEISNSVRKVLGYEQSEVKGKNINFIYNRPEIIKKIMERLLEENYIESLEFEGERKDGSTCILILNIKLVVVESGFDKIICIGKDVTDYIEARRKQTEVQEEYKLIFDKMLDGMIIYELIYDEKNNPSDVNVVKANPAVAKHLGLMNQTDIEKIYTKNITGNKKNLEKLHNILVTGNPTQREIYISDMDIYLFVNAFKLNSSQIVIMFHDVTNLRKMERRQREMAVHLEAIFESTDDIIFSVDKNYNIKNFNSSFKNFIKKNFNHEIKIEQSLMQILPHKVMKEWQQFYYNTINSNRHNFEYYIKHENKYVDLYFNPIYDNKRICGTAVFIRDITAKKKAEHKLRKVNRDLEHVVEERTIELMSAVSELEAFAYTVSHDLKSPLRAIDGYSKIIIEDYGETLEKEALSMINNISDISRDRIKLIDRVLHYSTTYKAAVHKEIFDIREIFANVFCELKTACPERIIEFNVEVSIPLVKADKILIQQAVSNVLGNAVKFTKNKGVAVINVGYFKEENEHVFSVEDNGAGFDMEYSGKLFSMFQRLHTKEEFEGSGIGLATVKKIIQKHGGRVWIEGKKNVGTKIYFTLPVE